MYSKFITALIATITLGAAASAGAIHKGDIFLMIKKGAIVTGLLEDKGFEPSRVFGAEFGEDPKDPYFTDEPGFDNFEETFPFPSDVGFNILRPLMVWNGDGFDIAKPERMTISYGPRERTTGDGFVKGFGIPVAEDGSWHTHLGFELWSDSAKEGVNPADGIYLLGLELWSSESTIMKSESFYLVFNNGMDEKDHDVAIKWVENNIVPEPTTLTLLTIGGAYTLIKRRKRHHS